MTTEQQKDEQLWQIAQARASFRKSLFSYVILNAFFTGIWFFTSGPGSHFWPIWGMLGWGIGLAFQYYAAYNSQGDSSVQQEYEKLKNKQS